MKNGNPKQIKWTYLGIALVAIVAIIFIFRQPLYNQLYSWDLIPKPETYTELYFAATPPKSFVPGQQQTISFVVHNVQYQETAYTYTIEQLDSKGTILATLAKDTFSLAQDKKTTVKVPLTFIDNDTTAKLRVTLSFLEKNKTNPTTESIYYLVKRGEG